MTGPWNRDLDKDLKAIRSWGADALVTLMEEHELVSVQVSDLGERAEAIGLEWHFLPIRDVDVPDAGFEPRWRYARHRLNALLDRGRSVVLHCRGGLGRTGMIAARILAERGMAPADAVKAVRQSRPGTIETQAQERHVLEAEVQADDSIHAGRVFGCLLGGAVGDAFGYAIEFDRMDAILKRHGSAGLVEPVYRKGRLIVSDDTQMTLFTAEGMLRALAADPAAGDVLVVEEIRRAYLDWLDTQQGGGATKAYAGVLAQRSILRHPRAPGNTCLSALRAGGSGTVEAPINHSKGCGGVMRTAPIGLVRTWDAERCFRLGCAAAALTHGHPGGWLPGGAIAHLVRQLLDGAVLAEAATAATDRVAADDQGAAVADLMREALRRAEAPAADPYVDIRALGEGWVGDEALAIGLYAALRGPDIVDAIRMAANHDGDSDSTASIAGQILGAAQGVGALRHAWVRRLDVIDEVLTVASRLLDADQNRWKPV